MGANLRRFHREAGRNCRQNKEYEFGRFGRSGQRPCNLCQAVDVRLLGEKAASPAEIAGKNEALESPRQREGLQVDCGFSSLECRRPDLTVVYQLTNLRGLVIVRPRAQRDSWMAAPTHSSEMRTECGSKEVGWFGLDGTR